MANAELHDEANDRLRTPPNEQWPRMVVDAAILRRLLLGCRSTSRKNIRLMANLSNCIILSLDFCVTWGALSACWADIPFSLGGPTGLILKIQ